MATAKQKAAARKNIKKAQAALKRKRGGTKTTRKAEKRGKGKASAKQRAAARKNIKKAQAANRRKGKSHTKAPRKAAKRAAAKHPKHSTKAKHPKRAKHKGKHKGGKGKRKGGRKTTRIAHRGATTHTTRTEIIKMPGHTTKVAILPIQTSGHRKPAKRKASKRGKGRGKGKKKGKGKGRGSRARETGYAMENPLSGVEIFVGGLTGLLGFGVADVLDRYLATHALGGTTGAYTDTPPTSGTYSGLYNASAVIAPMGLLRWGVGLGLTAVPLVAARWVKAPVGRSALQFFGFGVGFRVVGKGLQTLFAYVFRNASFGQRLYDGEIRASYLKAGGGTIPSTVSLPSSGLGEVPELGCGKCANCITGVGACCSRGGQGSMQTPQPTQSVAPPPPPPPPPPPTQVPWTPVVPGTFHTVPVRVGPPGIVSRPQAPRTGTQGVPSDVQRRSPYQWGSQYN
jgi:hypothetical protein